MDFNLKKVSNFFKRLFKRKDKSKKPNDKLIFPQAYSPMCRHEIKWISESEDHKKEDLQKIIDRLK